MDYQPSIPIERATSPRRRWHWWVLAIVLIAVIVATLFSIWPSDEPTYNGRPISQFFPNLLSPEQSTNYLIGSEAVRSLGTNALPTVLSVIQSKEPYWARFYFSVQSRLPRPVDQFVRKRLDPWHYRNRYNGALNAVGILGTNAAPAASELVAQLPKVSFGRASVYATSLWKIGPDVVPPLKPLLTDPDMQVRRMAAYVCYMLAERAADAAPELIAGIPGTDENHRNLIAQTLGRMGPGVIPTTTELLNSNNKDQILVGLIAMERSFNLQSLELLETVFQLVNHPDREIRIRAAILNSERWPLDPGNARTTLKTRNETSPRLEQYLTALVTVESNMPRLIEALKEGLEAPDYRTRQTCINQLIRRGVVDERVGQALNALETEASTRLEVQQVGRLREQLNAKRTELSRTN